MRNCGEDSDCEKQQIQQHCFYSKTNQMHNISNSFYFGTTLRMFRTVSPPIIGSLRLYIQHQVYSVAACWQAATEYT